MYEHKKTICITFVQNIVCNEDISNVYLVYTFQVKCYCYVNSYFV